MDEHLISKKDLLQRYGISYMLVGVEPKSSREYGGYSSLLDITDPGRVDLPPRYSYAKYSNRNLASYKGSFAYPTILPDEMMRTSAWGGSSRTPTSPPRASSTT